MPSICIESSLLPYLYYHLFSLWAQTLGMYKSKWVNYSASLILNMQKMSDLFTFSGLFEL